MYSVKIIQEIIEIYQKAQISNKDSVSINIFYDIKSSNEEIEILIDSRTKVRGLNENICQITEYFDDENSFMHHFLDVSKIQLIRDA